MASTIRSWAESLREPKQLQTQYGPVRSDDSSSQEKGTTHTPTVVVESRTSKILIIACSLLCLGWATTLVCWYTTSTHSNGDSLTKSMADNGPLHVYHNTPIPKEVFIPVKKVFEVEEKYVGGGPEVEKEWDKLVAGHDAVWIENPKQWGLGEGIVAPYDHPNTPVPKPQDFYVISILHQLHCLVSTPSASTYISSISNILASEHGPLPILRGKGPGRPQRRRH